jgi:hypothetical protein
MYATEFAFPELEQLQSSIEALAERKRQLWERDFGPRRVKLSCDAALQEFMVGDHRRNTV